MHTQSRADTQKQTHRTKKNGYLRRVSARGVMHIPASRHHHGTRSFGLATLEVWSREQTRMYKLERTQHINDDIIKTSSPIVLNDIVYHI
jgi:hypothetical protein